MKYLFLIGLVIFLKQSVCEISYGKLLWSDEFDGNKLDPNFWELEIGGGGWGNQELQFYTDSNHVVKNGNLKITTRNENKYGHSFTSSRLKGKKLFQYGIFEMRAKLPKGRGTWPAFIMIASKTNFRWPDDGIIDIIEHVGMNPGFMVAKFDCGKYNRIKGTTIQNETFVQNPFDEFHTYTVDWNSKRMIFYVDGKQYLLYENKEKTYESWPFDNNFFITITSAVGGWWAGQQGIDLNTFPTDYTIDYIRQYESIGSN